MFSLAQGTELGELELLEIYEYFDEPRLFSCRNRSGQTYIGLSIEETSSYDSWLYVPVSQERLHQVEGGVIDLQSAFLRSEDGAIYLINRSRDSGAFELIRRTVEDLNSSMLPAGEEFLELEAPDRPRLASAGVIAAQRQREVLRFALRVPDVPHDEAPTSLVGNVLAGLQELLAAIAQAVRSQPTTRGRIQPDILKASELHLVGTYAGSLGLDLASAEMADLFGGSLLADALALFSDLLSAGSDSERLGPLLEELKPRVASKYRSLIGTLAEADVGTTIEWGSVDPSRGGSFQLERDAIRAIAATIALVGTEFSETYEVTGPLVALNARTRYFEIEDRLAERRLSGRLDPGQFAEDQEFTINAVYHARIVETIEVSGVTGEEKVTRVLTELRPTSHPGDPGPPSLVR